MTAVELSVTIGIIGWVWDTSSSTICIDLPLLQFTKSIAIFSAISYMGMFLMMLYLLWKGPFMVGIVSFSRAGGKIPRTKFSRTDCTLWIQIYIKCLRTYKGLCHYTDTIGILWGGFYISWDCVWDVWRCDMSLCSTVMWESLTSWEWCSWWHEHSRVISLWYSCV